MIRLYHPVLGRFHEVATGHVASIYERSGWLRHVDEPDAPAGPDLDDLSPDEGEF